MISERAEKRRFPIGTLLLSLVALLGLGVILYRYANGLGDSTDLSDGRAWGMWISLDLYCGVALAAGGFTMAATVYIFAREKYHVLIRPAILTAFLGYVLVVLALLVDLGQPWYIWRALAYRNVHSPLFEVAMCVMTYTIVLALEFSPVVFERLNWQVPMRTIRAIQIPLIILGIVLSTLHQSSLGSMLLMMPETLNSLWYTPILPVLFLISAIAVGPAMVLVESTLSGKAFGHKLDIDILGGLARVLPYILGVYLAFKLGDLVVSKQLSLIFADDSKTILWWVEVIGGVVLPIVFLSRASVRQSRTKIFLCALLVVAGLILNRFNVSWFALSGRPGYDYFPHWMEIATSVGLVAWAVIIVMLANRLLAMHQPAEVEEKKKPAPLVQAAKPTQVARVRTAIMPSVLGPASDRYSNTQNSRRLRQ